MLRGDEPTGSGSGRRVPAESVAPDGHVRAKLQVKPWLLALPLSYTLRLVDSVLLHSIHGCYRPACRMRMVLTRNPVMKPVPPPRTADPRTLPPATPNSRQPTRTSSNEC